MNNLAEAKHKQNLKSAFIDIKRYANWMNKNKEEKDSEYSKKKPWGLVLDYYRVA